LQPDPPPTTEPQSKGEIYQILLNAKYHSAIAEKLPIPIDSSVEWAGLQQHLRNLPIHQRALFIRRQQRRLPTKLYLHNIYPETQCPDCPYCSSHESEAHVYSCTDPRAKATRELARAKLRNELNKLSPTITTAITTGIAAISDDQPLPDSSNYDPQLQTFIDNQNDIGWGLLLIGYIPTILYDSLSSPPKQHRKNWVAKLIAVLDAYHAAIWKARNALAHSSRDTATTDQQLISLQMAVLAWYNRQHQLTPAGRSLLPQHSDTIYQLAKPALAELLVQLTNYHSQWSRAPSHTQDIRNFFARYRNNHSPPQSA
jgi:hypothetical protein